MATKSTKKATKKKAARASAERALLPRDRVITFRISAEEATLISRAADRIPLARYSRDAVLAKAAAVTKR